MRLPQLSKFLICRAKLTGKSLKARKAGQGIAVARFAKAKKLPKVVLEREIYGGATHFARCTSTQSSNESDGMPLAVALANWFRGSHID
jgi:hypothetical protein